MHEFVVLVDGKLKTYRNFEDIPEKIDNVIKFNPCMPKPPHKPHEHNRMSEWGAKLQELLKRETNGNT